MVVPKKGTRALLARPCRVAVRWLAFQQGSSVICRRVLLLLLGAHASSVVVVSLVLWLSSSSACMSVWVEVHHLAARVLVVFPRTILLLSWGAVVCLLPLLSVGCLVWWCSAMAFGAVLRTVATFVAKVPPFELF
ncbi:hypothetical protein Taro_055538 [Colocasia esculenta]|uniref:Transmembrane protein n=1 Tax=Colocasia esculenta TaxID=4460 RepID=A0A843XUI4_COLES|nr:hypothetical protein [Colocasia esculenta]